MSRSGAGTASSATQAGVDRAGVTANSSGIPVASARVSAGTTTAAPVRIELPEHLGEEPRGLTGTVRSVCS